VARELTDLGRAVAPRRSELVSQHGLHPVQQDHVRALLLRAASGHGLTVLALPVLLQDPGTVEGLVGELLAELDHDLATGLEYDVS
jgi:hypothetical protein